MNIPPQMRLPAEWEPKGAVLMAWPFIQTDWATMLNLAQPCCVSIVEAIAPDVPVLMVGEGLNQAKLFLKHVPNVIYADCFNNDTWCRDFGPISTVDSEGRWWLNDFQFNGWGLKFVADQDNLITRRLVEDGVLREECYRNHLSWVLEGGSIESDGQGTILTTRSCLMSLNRNGAATKRDIERELHNTLGAERVLWLNHGYIPGDDTDGHIDTLARFISPDTIMYVEGQKEMLDELRRFTTVDGRPYNLLPLPAGPTIYHYNKQLPATYANFLILNQRVLMPTYGHPELDAKAIEAVSLAMPGYEVIGVDCQALIRQHGSLHCVTMQLPKAVMGNCGLK